MQCWHLQHYRLRFDTFQRSYGCLVPSQNIIIVLMQTRSKHWLLILITKNLCQMALIMKVHNLPEYSDDYCFMKWNMRKRKNRAVSNWRLNNMLRRFTTSLRQLILTCEQQYYFTGHGNKVHTLDINSVSSSKSLLWDQPCNLLIYLFICRYLMMLPQ
jgi:hypothetical protein